MADTSLPAVATAYNRLRVTLAGATRRHRNTASGRPHVIFFSALESSRGDRIIGSLPLLSIHCDYRSTAHERALIQRRQSAFRSGG